MLPSDEGPYRKYYALNAAGRDLLDESTKTWRGFADAMAALLENGTKEAA